MSNKQRKNTPADVKEPAALLSLWDLTKFVFKLYVTCRTVALPGLCWWRWSVNISRELLTYITC